VRHVAPGLALRVAGGDVGVGVDLLRGHVDYSALKVIYIRVLLLYS
jgi:hypothetical protein